jgi:two-component system sensor histidine kinase ChvG
MRRLLARISVRLLLFNVLLVFLPVAGFLSLDIYERKLLEAQERAMVQQARLLAAALSEQGPLSPALAEPVLQRLAGRTEARLRIVESHGATVADSAALGPSPAPLPAAPYRGGAPPPAVRENPVYRLGAWLYRLGQTAWRAPQEWAREIRAARSRKPAPPAGPPPEIRAALAGRYGAALHDEVRDGRLRTVLSSAVPVRSGGRVVGAVVVSQSTLRVLAALHDVRLKVFRVFLASVAAAVLLSLVLAGTIARPLRRLRDEANALVDRRGRLRGRFRGSDRADEIGDLSRSLEQLTGRLEAHLARTESFAADVSHELKNPLAAIRGATELLAEVEDPADRDRFLGVAQREVARMERLLAGVREIGALDARMEHERIEEVEVGGLLRELAERAALRPAAAERGVRIEVRAPAAPVRVRASAERLTQVLENLLDNAESFSPPGGTVEATVERARESGTVTLAIEDRGPGVPEPHLERIFDRFFSYRPDEPRSRDGHTGLGLAIVKAIVEGYGGEVAVRNRDGGGARLEVRLPAAAEPDR